MGDIVPLFFLWYKNFMKKFGICYNKTIDNSVKVMKELEEELKKNNVQTEILDIDELKSGYDFIFVIGGDGTILKAARFYAKTSTPIFGINLGRLGFLSQSSKEEIKISVEKILNGEYRIEKRSMLQSGEKIALNDFVVKGTTTGRTSRFSLKINNKLVCDYLADGIIVTTPTGSTAYGLSAGGPVISPKLNAFVIVPICPHTLTARPIVIPDDEIITICSDKDLTNYVASTDGQEFYEFVKEIEIKKSAYTAKLALLDEGEFYSILRNKLHWGTSPACIK